jgi:hypothetical protein
MIYRTIVSLIDYFDILAKALLGSSPMPDPLTS